MPKSTTLTPLGGRCASRFATSTPNASSPRKMLPTPATSILPCIRNLAVQGKRLDFFRRKEESVSRLTEKSKVPPGVVLKHNGQVHVVIEIALDRLHHRNFALQRHVHDVGVFLWPQAHPISSFQRNAEHGDALQPRVFRLLVPVHHGFSPRGRRLRIVP